MSLRDWLGVKHQRKNKKLKQRWFIQHRCTASDEDVSTERSKRHHWKTKPIRGDNRSNNKKAKVEKQTADGQYSASLRRLKTINYQLLSSLHPLGSVKNRLTSFLVSPVCCSLSHYTLRHPHATSLLSTPSPAGRFTSTSRWRCRQSSRTKRPNENHLCFS